jgi:hypothetical protein
MKVKLQQISNRFTRDSFEKENPYKQQQQQKTKNQRRQECTETRVQAPSPTSKQEKQLLFFTSFSCWSFSTSLAPNPSAQMQNQNQTKTKTKTNRQTQRERKILKARVFGQNETMKMRKSSVKSWSASSIEGCLLGLCGLGFRFFAVVFFGLWCVVTFSVYFGFTVHSTKPLLSGSPFE